MFNSTYYSILNATSKPKNLVAKLKELEYKVAIICDDNLFGTLEFYYECKKAEITPIISTKVEIEGVNFILIAQNKEGYKNLSRMSKFEKITLEEFSKYIENIIVVFNFDNLEEEMVMKAKDLLKDKKLFAGIRKVKTIEDSIKEALMKKLELPFIPCEISLYINKEDYRNQIALRAIDEKGLYDNYATKANQIDSFVKEKSYWLNNYPEETKNLMEIIKSCENDYTFGNPTPPKYKFVKETSLEFGLKKSTTEEELFAYLSREGLKQRLVNVPVERHQEYIERLEFEINIINQMKFPGYMLIVWDFTNAAKEMDIPVGPGRGSAAGSLVAYSLKITNLDPIPYGLLFERFLNPERVSMPDIDMDFCQSRRGEIIDYVIEKYGIDNVAQIITFGQMGGKSVIRDAGRILSYPLHLTDYLAKIIPETPGIKLSEAYELEKATIDSIIQNDSHALRVWNLAKQLEGTKRNLGVHAAGLVISDNDITEKCPKYHVGGTQVVQYEGKYLEDVNLIKFDFLGLKTLSVIDSCIKMVKQTKGVSIDLETLKMDDKNVFDYISTGETKGMFQIESSGMQTLCKRLKPDCFEDLIAILALYRPGPMESGMLEDFIQRKRGEQEISYFFNDMTTVLEPILKPTYGVIVYQEQVMQIVQEIGGFSLGESDIIRRAMGKKQIEYMNQKAEEFASRAESKGFKKSEAKELFGLIEKFAGYGFNKSHSAAYALVTYITAMLKTYYPVEYMASLMNFDHDKHDKLIPMIQEVNRMGIVLRKPDINSSTALFSVEGDEIIYGLKGIKGVGADVDKVIDRRNLGFDSLASFIKFNRSKNPKINKRVFTGLIYAGALDNLASRKYLSENLDNLMKITKPNDFEALYSIPNETLFAGEMKLLEIIKQEKEYLGHIYANPFEKIQSGLDMYELPTYESMLVGPNKFVGWIESKIIKNSKKGNKYGRFNVIDINKDSCELIIFEKGIEAINPNLDLRVPVIFSVNKKDDSIFINSIEALNKTNMNNYFSMKNENAIKKDSEISIKIGDYKSLLENYTSQVINLTENNKTIFILKN